MKKKDKVAYRLKSYENIDVPYHVWTVFGDQSKTIHLAGDQASFGEDFKYLHELRTAIEFYVDQLDGKVEWND